MSDKKTYEELKAQIIQLYADGKQVHWPNREQIRDWVYGQIRLTGAKITHEAIDKILEKLGMKK